MGRKNMVFSLKNDIETFPAGRFIAEIDFDHRSGRKLGNFVQPFLINFGTGNAVADYIYRIKSVIVLTQIAF